MRKFSQQQALPASADKVIEIVTSEDYLRFRYDDPQLLGFELDINCDEEARFACDIRRTVDPGDSIPRVAKRLVGDKFVVRQETEWQREGPPYAGKIRVTIPGMPGSISGDLTLEAVDENNSRMTSNGRIEVNIPLAGGQLERMLAGEAEQTFSESMTSIDAYLKKQA